VKICEDFVPKFVDKTVGYFISAMHCLTLLFSPKNFLYQKQYIIPHPPYLPDLAPCDFSLSPIKDKLNGCHFDTIEVIEAEPTGGIEHSHRT
jgi:hypothetical protein